MCLPRRHPQSLQYPEVLPVEVITNVCEVPSEVTASSAGVASASTLSFSVTVAAKLPVEITFPLLTTSSENHAHVSEIRHTAHRRILNRDGKRNRKNSVSVILRLLFFSVESFIGHSPLSCFSAIKRHKGIFMPFDRRPTPRRGWGEIESKLLYSAALATV